ncbi:MAG: phosphoribosylanthranilate isomerase, partial [Bacteroidales bacterium]
MKIKVCGMRDPLNIKEISNAGPDYLGFIFFSGSKRYVGPDADNAPFQQITGR